MRLNSMMISMLTIILGAFVACSCTHQASVSGEHTGYNYYVSGDRSAQTPATPGMGLMLIGGSDWSPEAWDWFVDKAGNGHIAIIRASQDGSDGEWIMDEIGDVASVETIVFSNRDASFDPKVEQVLTGADAIFIAGGDQSKYVRFWQDTPVETALNAHVAAGRPIGGTSAGLAILGDVGYGALAEEAVDSPEALSNPHGPKVTLVGDFLDVPFLDHIITDTHFMERDRLGRLVAFVAQTRATSDPDAVGLGIDEDTALTVDADGKGKLYTTSDGLAWLVEPVAAPDFAASGALNWDGIKLTGIGPGSMIDFNTMRVTNPAVVRTISIKDGELVDREADRMPAWSLAIHGGSGVITRGDLTPEVESAYRQSLEAALSVGGDVLRNGGTSLDAVEATIRVLEDDPLFNAGRGAVFDAEGRNQLDAAIMDGSTLNAGAVAAVSTTKHPITLARAVMERSRHVLLSGAGADQFASENEIEQVDPSYFRTEQRWQQHLEWKRDNQASIDPTHKFGTVGAVAIDSAGNLAAATSTGGLTGKQWGRIGDSPIIGAGTYAANDKCAVSGTGTGEYFIRESAGRQVCDRVHWNDQSIQDAADVTIGSIGALGGDGGLIAMDGQGRVAFAMNTEGMYRGQVSEGRDPVVAIYAEEPDGAR